MDYIEFTEELIKKVIRPDDHYGERTCKEIAESMRSFAKYRKWEESDEPMDFFNH